MYPFPDDFSNLPWDQDYTGKDAQNRNSLTGAGHRDNIPESDGGQRYYREVECTAEILHHRVVGIFDEIKKPRRNKENHENRHTQPYYLEHLIGNPAEKELGCLEKP